MNGNMVNITWGNGNSSDEMTTTQDHSVAAQVGLTALYIFGITVGTSGNILVIIAVAANRSMRTGTNYFIVSLSVADLLVTALCMPPFFVYNVFTWPIWPFGRISCQMLSYFVHTSVMASSLSLLSITYDRFVSVYFPLKRLKKPKQSLRIVSAIWIVSPFLLLPSAFHHGVFTKKLNGQVSVICTESWPTKAQLRSYQIYRICFYFLFVVQISVAYVLVGVRLFKRQQPGVRSNRDKKRSLLHKRKVVKMLLLVIACFSLSWLPYTINKMLIVAPPSTGFKAPDLFVFVGNMLGLLNSCVNPILYAVLNRNFRIAFKNALRCKCNSDAEERRRMVHTITIISKHEFALKPSKRIFPWRRGLSPLESQIEETSDNMIAKQNSVDYLSFEAYSELPTSLPKPTTQQGCSSEELLASSNKKQVKNKFEIKNRSIDFEKENNTQEGKNASKRARLIRSITKVEESFKAENGKANLGLGLIDEQSC